MDKSKIKAILWDADGVILKPREKFFSEYLAEKQNISLEKIIPFFKEDYKKIVIGQADLKTSLEKYLTDWNWQESVEDLIKYWFSLENKIQDNIIDVIKELSKNNFKNYIASDHSINRKENLMEEFGLNKHFAGSFFSAELGTTKDKLEYFQKIAEKLNLNLDEILFIDDEEENIEAAKKTGVQAIFFTDIEKLKTELDI